MMHASLRERLGASARVKNWIFQSQDSSSWNLISPEIPMSVECFASKVCFDRPKGRCTGMRSETRPQPAARRGETES